ncbi:MAG: choice-of-anchor Q domain-containing protein [Bacteroidota bacterium]|nr:choice-of-anchor Q domain-containing protein [Bacteroidota bacterium]
MRIYLLLIVFIVSKTVLSQIITVKQDGTGDVTTIQEGIDMATDGDTVLVWPGTYIENVTCFEKNIAIGSLTMTTGNTSYVNQTIIDGNLSGSCMHLENCNPSTLIDGFTLINGSGADQGYLSGGGVSIGYSQVHIRNCDIIQNKVHGIGGGIYCTYSDIVLSNTNVINNHAFVSGGGIYAGRSTVKFDSINLCNIYLNYSAEGTDIYKAQGSPMKVFLDTGTILTPDYYYFYPRGSYGIVFSNDITYQINVPKINQVSQDLHVSPEGDNENSGLTAEEPLKDIWYALLKKAVDTIQPDTIHLANGSYAPSTGERFPLSLKKSVSIKGATRDSTILDGENEIYLMHGIVYMDNYKISDLTLQHGNGNINSPFGYGAIYIMDNRNSVFENLMFKENYGRVSSCGYISNSNGFMINKVVFQDNSGGGALRIGHSNAIETYVDTVRLYNCQFIANVPDYNIQPGNGGGGGASRIKGQSDEPDLITAYIYNCLFHSNHTRQHPYGGMSQISMVVSRNANAFVTNCTFGDNTSDNLLGGNIGIINGSDLYIYNSVLFDSDPAELYMYNDIIGNSSLYIYNSLVQGGEEGIRLYSGGNSVYYDPTNIDEDPLWDTANYYPYGLTAGSPCIDAGTLDLPEGIELPDTDLAGNPRVYGNTVDMGAYEYGPWVGIPYYPPPKKKTTILKVAPNPFNYQTNITYTAPESGHITIRVYDIQGQQVATLIDVKGMQGSGTINWDGRDERGFKIKSGTYIISLFINSQERDAVKIIRL